MWTVWRCFRSEVDRAWRRCHPAGAKLVIGTSDARKDKLDTIFKTSLVIKF
jgi:5-methylthioribose kinase